MTALGSRAQVVLAHRPQSLLARFVFGLLLLAGAVLSSACPARDAAPADEERPPIIISSGSVDVSVLPKGWTKVGNGAYRQDSDASSVASFSASTGNCTVTGDKLTVKYGSNVITLERKRNGLFGKRNAQVQFPANASVDDSTHGKLSVATNDSLVSVSNGGSAPGDTCAVDNKMIRVVQNR